MLDFLALMFAGVLVVAGGQLLAWLAVGLLTSKENDE